MGRRIRFFPGSEVGTSPTFRKGSGPRDPPSDGCALGQIEYFGFAFDSCGTGKCELEGRRSITRNGASTKQSSGSAFFLRRGPLGAPGGRENRRRSSSRGWKHLLER